ncbi:MULTISPECIES: hypothetical protein [unclassified Microcoleus]|uniref:hypothetical protein n=1 Tax=unclassified Microcoleus TaxID=2642155 RepID=UPI001DE83299|nr:MULTISPECIES: hypothetical protein [unclassified Microcoleus]MCC3564490.1 hypothetical protein [Microcoleus sp. PH2017_31_RDM_U_A]MCC3577949.1 hypothetical protein [Microcoleus sp. PH2017_32_RDM_D_A]MCC3615636.1 hypothetical protein [Microcoleus sp. PH2017_38_RDM_U_B]TAG60288.1 MAG: hypothetical protein EAZ28_07870 [Oscillatoriales cyanobacterium]
MKKCKPELKTIWHVQLTLDLPQFSIESGARVLVLGGPEKTGRLRPVYLSPYRVCFPGGSCKIIPRHLLVEIQ